MPEVVERAGRAARAWARPAAVTGVALVVSLASTLLRDVYYGIPDSMAVPSITATCQPGAGRASCEVAVVRLNPGRFYLSTRGAAASLSVAIDDGAASTQSHALLVRPEAAGRLRLGVNAGTATATEFDRDAPHAGERVIVDLPGASPLGRRITFVAQSHDDPIVISEFGFFADGRELLPPGPLTGRLTAVSFYSTVAALATLAVCVFVVAAAWLAPEAMRRPLPWLLTALCLAVCVLDLGTMFSPRWSRDIRSMYGAELIRSGNDGNLTGGLYEGSRLVQGLGETTAPGVVAWHRMPGYGLWCGLAALIGRTTDRGPADVRRADGMPVGGADRAAAQAGEQHRGRFDRRADRAAGVVGHGRDTVDDSARRSAARSCMAPGQRGIRAVVPDAQRRLAWMDRRFGRPGRLALAPSRGAAGADGKRRFAVGIL
jgi:hypothetical protein